MVNSLNWDICGYVDGWIYGWIGGQSNGLVDELDGM